MLVLLMTGYARFQVLRVALLKVKVFWGVALLLEQLQMFQGIILPLNVGIFHPTTQNRIPGGFKLQVKITKIKFPMA
jgi:hypothetical protein